MNKIKRDNNSSAEGAESAEAFIKRKHPQDWDEIPQWHIDELNEFAAQQQPTAEGAEEILAKYEIGYDEQYHRMVYEGDALKAMYEFATLHAQRIAEKMKEANQFILDIARAFSIETDGVGFDGLTLSIDDFKEAAEKMVEERLKEDTYMTCDICGCHPSVIITTSFGRFCQQHAKYI